MPDAPVQEPPKHMQLANPDAIPTSRMTVLFMVMLISAAGNTAMQSVLPAIGTARKASSGGTEDGDGSDDELDVTRERVQRSGECWTAFRALHFVRRMASAKRFGFKLH